MGYKSDYYVSTTYLDELKSRMTTNKMLTANILNANQSLAQTTGYPIFDLKNTVDDGNSKLGDFEESIIETIFAIFIVLGKHEKKKQKIQVLFYILSFQESQLIY